jgi:hypothetical protein
VLSGTPSLEYFGFLPTIFAALHLTYQQIWTPYSLCSLQLFFFATKQLAFASH